MAPAKRPANPTYNFGGSAKVRPDAVVLPASATNRVIVSENKLVFPKEGNEWLLSLPVGTPLAGDRRRHSIFESNNALGILRKVRSTSSDATTITVLTEPATLPEIIEGDFELATPDNVAIPISPASLDMNAIYFSDWGGIDLANCDDNGICTVPPDKGDGPPAFQSTTPLPPANETLLVPASGALAAAGDIKAQIDAASPEAIANAITDLVAARSLVRGVREKGIFAYSKPEIKKLFAVAAHNLEESGDQQNANAMRILAGVVLNAADAVPVTPGSGTQHSSLVGPGLRPTGFFSDAWDACKTGLKAVADVVGSLLSIDTSLSLGTFGKTKEKPWTINFVDIHKEKKLGATVFELNAGAKANVHGYVSSKARLKGSFNSNSISFEGWLEGNLAAGAQATAELELILKSFSPSSDEAKEFAKSPEKSKDPWQIRLASLGPYAGPALGPIPTSFRINIDAKCDWQLNAKITAKAEARVEANAKLGARYKSGEGWSKVSDFNWIQDFDVSLTGGGGAQIRCGVAPEILWLIADAAGPKVTSFGGLKTALSYEEDCIKVKSTKPNAVVQFGVSAFIELGLGGKAQFLGKDLGSIGPITVFEQEWPLYTKEWDFPGSGFGYCLDKCKDKVKDGAETDMDCGGPDCNPCQVGKKCSVGSDCETGGCSIGLCEPAPSCTDSKKNAAETDVDCGGGTCKPCLTTQSCSKGSDCATGVCSGGKCAAPSCSDGVKNGAETDTDCGGSCSTNKCATGKVCAKGSDCATGVCSGNKCAAPACTDGVKNGGETDVDCGGPCATKCAPSKGCSAGSDCGSGVCSAGICANPSCTDGVKNGNESDIDCGGSCGKCATDKGCSVGLDCIDSVCSGGKCAAATCADGAKNGAETDVDCGNACSNKCDIGQGCAAGADCMTNTCIVKTCASATCGDGQLQSGEQCDGAALNGATCATVLGAGAIGTLACLSNCAFDSSQCALPANCGNAKKEGAEQCDGSDLGGATCASSLGAGYTGSLSCKGNCTLDLSACVASAQCGNGIINPGEQCDGAVLNGATCVSALGSGATGTVSCSANCTLDASLCQRCGDGLLQGSEACDGSTFGASTCASVKGAGYTGTLACTAGCAIDASACQKCGDGTIDGTEQCDGAALGGATCASVKGAGWSGTIVCGGSCDLDTSGCIPPKTCGDGQIQSGEQCDGATLGGATCATILGAGATGTLACTAGCAFDSSQCVPPIVCGDAKKEGAEQCDGSDLGGATCASSLGAGYTGSLSCKGNCTLDLSACVAPAQCGDGIINPGEQCDGAALGGATCVSALGSGATGTVSCSANCTLDASLCQRCGDGLLQGSEACDGSTFGASTCASVKGAGYTGTLACTAGCAIDASACQKCGDGTIDGTEQCDGAALGGATCASVKGAGFTGTLACGGSCTFDTSACQKCGDGTIDGTEQCDGAALNGQTCASIKGAGFTGALACSSSCTFDSNACQKCGDGVRQGTEQCDGPSLGPNTCASVTGVSSATGTLSCSGACTLLTIGCKYCGNGAIDPGEQCDGSDLGAGTCSSVQGVPAVGTLGCSASCQYDASACTSCSGGQVAVGNACVTLDPPQQIAPLSTATVTSTMPTLHWKLASGTTGAFVEICQDRACALPVTSFTAVGSSGKVPLALPAGTYFWRTKGVSQGVQGGSYSIAWEFVVGHASAPVDSSWGTVFDGNGDGFADVIAGSNIGNPSGSVFIYDGSASGVVTATPHTVGFPSGTIIGAVVNAGDVNGDGYSDLAVTALGDFFEGTPNTVQVFFGSASGIPASPSVTLNGPNGSSQFGGENSLSSAGDVNGDGYADLIVGEAESQKARLYLGGPSGPSDSNFSLISGSLGRIVSGAGDVNGDGFGDVIMNNYQGSVFVYHGSASGLPASPSLTITGPGGAGPTFGSALNYAGDTNGDGYADVVIGSSNAHTAYVYQGSASGLSAVPTTSLSGTWNFGSQVSGAGDVNADGYADIVLTNRKDSVAIFLGSASGTAAVSTTTIPLPSYAATGGGDYNGDGISDVIVGDSSFYKVYVYPGSSVGLVIDSPTIISGSSNFGVYVASVNDPLGIGAGGVGRCPLVRHRRGQFTVCLPG